MAARAYMTGLLLFVLIIAVLLVIDGFLISRGRKSISDFLRQNPYYYWVGVGIMAAYTTIMTLHLFIFH